MCETSNQFKFEWIGSGLIWIAYVVQIDLRENFKEKIKLVGYI